MDNILISKTVFVIWNSKTKNHYVNKGYIFTKMKDKFEVKINDLTYGANIKIKLKCDYCGEIYEKYYSDWNRSHNNISKDACSNCKIKKTKEITLIKYGVENSFDLKEFRDKANNTILEKYGVANVSQSSEIQNKIKQNNLLKYGVENTSQLDSVKEKAIKSNRIKYGVDYPMQTKEFQEQLEKTSYEKYGVRRPTQNSKIRDKVKTTNLKRYGCEFITQNYDILSKSINSRYLHGNFTCSKQQYELYENIGGELNFPYHNFIIDIAYPDEKIAVEWNGSGHNLSVKLGKITQQQFDRNENFRRKVLFENNWRIITFVTKKDIIPSNYNVKNIINYCLDYIHNGGHSIYVMVDDNEIVFKNQHININNII